MSLPSGSPDPEPPQPIEQGPPQKLDAGTLAAKTMNIHPRAAEVADKLRAWLDENGLNWGIQIRIMRGQPPKLTDKGWSRDHIGYDWMSTANDTVIVLTLDYHENPFWLNAPATNKLQRFLKKEGLDLLKLDCTRWYVSEPPPRDVAEAMGVKELTGVAMKPTFVPYKSQVTGDEGMALHIPWPEKITTEQWDKISRMMKQKGYDIRGGADAQRFVYGYMQKFQNKVPPVLQDWIDTIALVLDVKAPSQSPDVKAAGATPASKVFRRAIKEWGTTHDPALAGYILPSGALLDMSGANQGGGTNRAYDHRQVEQFFDEKFNERVDAMHAFMDMGAIRWMPEGNSLDIRKSPTSQQLTTLRRVLESVRGNMIYVDVFWPDYGSSAAEYPGRIAPERIVNDIKNFYKTGEMKQPSQVQQFHLAAETAVDRLLAAPLFEYEEEQLELPLDDDDGTGPPLDPDEIGAMHDKLGITKGFKQIDGDFGDPWQYGGTWYSAGIESDPKKWASIVHTDGTETEGVEEFWSGSRMVKDAARMPEWRAKIARLKATKYADDEDDERATDEVLDEIAAKMNDGIEITVYRTNADDPNTESWVTDRLDDVLSSVGVTKEQWDEMGPEGRLCIATQYFGWHEFDHYPEKYNKTELSNYLGLAL